MKNIWDYNPIQRYLLAKQMLRKHVKGDWDVHTRIKPGGWRAEDEDGRGPWWYVFEYGGKTYVAFRGQVEYTQIKEAIEKWRR